MRKMGVIIMIIILLLQSGCWSVRELDELAIVLGIGIDKDAKGQYSVTIRIATPQAQQPGMGGQKGKPHQQSWILHGTGKNINDAFDDVMTTSPRDLFFGQTNFLILGKELLQKDKLSNVMDIIFRHRGLRLNLHVTTTNGKAQKAFESFSAVEGIPALALEHLLSRSTIETGESIETNAMEVIRDLSTIGIEPIMSRIELEMGTEQQAAIAEKKVKSQVIKGVGVIRDEKLAGFLTPYETKGLIWVLPGIQTEMVIPFNGVQKGEKATVETEFFRQKIRTELKGGQLSFSITVNVKGVLTEYQGDTLLNERDIRKLENELNKEIKKQITSMLKKTKELKTDVIGLGKHVHSKYPREWSEQFEEGWNDRFASLPVQIKVESKIIHSEMLQKTIPNR